MCEDALITPVGVRGLLHFGLGCLRVDDSVLTGDGLAVPLGVVCLFPLKVLELSLERPLQRLDLCLLERIAGIACGITLEELDLVLDLGVSDLCLRNDALELGRRAVVR